MATTWLALTATGKLHIYQTCACIVVPRPTILYNLCSSTNFHPDTPWYKRMLETWSAPELLAWVSSSESLINKSMIASRDLKRLDRRSKAIATKRRSGPRTDTNKSTMQVGLPKQSTTSAEWGNPINAIDVEHIMSFSVFNLPLTHIISHYIYYIYYILYIIILSYIIIYPHASAMLERGATSMLPDVEELNSVLSKQNK